MSENGGVNVSGKGAPTKFKPEYVTMVEKMAIAGLTEIQMAGIFGVSEKTFNNWKNEYPDFLQANARGKQDPNAQVQQSLFKRAIGGFTVKEVTRDENGLVIKTVEKEVPPDTMAALKWLFNRMPKEWREKVEIEHSGAVDMTRLSPEEFDRKSKEILSAYLETMTGKNGE